MVIGNQLKTVLLLGSLTGLLLFVGNLIGGKGGLTFAFIFVIGMNFFSYWFSDTVVLKMYKAKPIKEQDNPSLFKTVKEVCNKAQIPMPKVCIIDAPYSNAFATGRNPAHAAVAVTKGIMQLLSTDELKGVIAHEISHIKNRDTLISTIAASIAGVISYVAMMSRWAAIFGGMNKDNEGGSSGIEFIVLAILTPILAAIIQMAISRSREYIADATGAKLVGDGKGLASALEKLENSKNQVSLKPTSQAQTTAHMFITNPFKGKSVLKLFSTHPNSQERIKRLKNMTF
jgi:heat shock protein HtpX